MERFLRTERLRTDVETCLMCCAFGGVEEMGLPFIPPLWCLTIPFL